MDEFYNKHYITVDDKNRILSGWSDGPHPDRDTTGAICINEQGGYQFRLIVEGKPTQENPDLMNWGKNMIPVPAYKWDGSQVIARTEEEIEADRAALSTPDPTPTMEERITSLETSKANQTDVDELTEALDLLLSGDTGEVAEE